jgi:hypothetical protein
MWIVVRNRLSTSDPLSVKQDGSIVMNDQGLEGEIDT